MLGKNQLLIWKQNMIENLIFQNDKSYLDDLNQIFQDCVSLAPLEITSIFMKDMNKWKQSNENVNESPVQHWQILINMMVMKQCH